MSLREYQKKRDFDRTAEPAGKNSQSETGRLFVVQKHDASRLHYDFRLELDGVLKSWAVPKGFSTKRGEQRLAVQVEDHPLDYAKFEGTIPQGEYGGGTVMVWDFGTYEVVGDAHSGLREGKLHCILKGEKLTGEWTLVHSSREKDEKNWFLIKTGETVPAITRDAEEHSALSRRTMEEIAGGRDTVWHSNRPLKDVPKTKAPPKGKKASRSLSPPVWVEPMKATLLETPPVGPGWIYELKWDGYRALALKHGQEVELISRNQKSLTAEFPELRDALAKLPAETAILDGEICALDPKGRPTFQLLQAREMGEGRPPLFYFAFDLLELEGRSFMARPLLERKAALQKLLGKVPDLVRYSAPIEGTVEELLAAVRAQGLEGLIGKRADSLYQPGLRSREWVKLKVSAEQEFVIGGFSPPKGTRKHLGALLVGYYEGERLHFAGKVGTGFNEAWLRRLHSLFRERAIPASPFLKIQTGGGRWGQGMTAAELRQCTWVKPELVCQVRFAEWTDQGLLRQPVFLGLRDDKAAGDVRRESKP